MPNNWGPIAKRAQSLPARCYRQITDGCHDYGRVCGAELVMVVTTSPLTNEPWRELLVLRCPDHVDTVCGILEYLPETWADGDGYGV